MDHIDECASSMGEFSNEARDDPEPYLSMRDEVVLQYHLEQDRARMVKFARGEGNVRAYYGSVLLFLGYHLAQGITWKDEEARCPGTRRAIALGPAYLGDSIKEVYSACARVSLAVTHVLSIERDGGFFFRSLRRR